MAELKEPKAVFKEPISDAEIDKLLGGIMPPAPDLVESLRSELMDSLSGVKIEDLERNMESRQQEVVSPEEIEAHPDLVAVIQKSIKRVDYVKDVFSAWQAKLLTGPDGVWLVQLPGRESPLPLERVLRGIRKEVLTPMVEAQKRQKGSGAGRKPFNPIS